MIPAKISLLTIGAYDVAVLRRFYLGLGWAETEISSDDYAVFKTAGVLLSIYPLKSMLEDAGLDLSLTSPSFKGVTLSLNVTEAAQVDDVMNQVREKGGNILKEAHDAVWGGRTGHFMDPENNLWEVAWNPTALFNEYGAMIDF